MKVESIAVSRTIEVPGQASVERSTKVNFRNAETIQEALELCGAKAETVLSYFNGGRWAELRTQVSNALAGKSNEQKAVEKMIGAFRSINPALTEEQARVMVLQMPGMEAATQIATEVIPAEINDTFFAERKEAKKAEKSTEATS